MATPLHEACSKGHLEVVTVAQARYRPSEGCRRTKRKYFTREEGHDENIVKLLVEHGAVDPEAPWRRSGSPRVRNSIDTSTSTDS
jgi:hypothetical protein